MQDLEDAKAHQQADRSKLESDMQHQRQEMHLLDSKRSELEKLIKVQHCFSESCKTVQLLTFHNSILQEQLQLLRASQQQVQALEGQLNSSKADVIALQQEKQGMEAQMHSLRRQHKLLEEELEKVQEQLQVWHGLLH